MKDENDKLKKLNSTNVTFQRDLTKKHDEELLTMNKSRRDLKLQLKALTLQKKLEREELEKRLQSANQCTAVVHDEEDGSFSHRLRNNLPNQNRDNGNFRNGRHMANSTELPGHGHARSVMSKVSRRVSEIMPVSHEDEEEALQGSEIPVTLEEEKF